MGFWVVALALALVGCGVTDHGVDGGPIDAGPAADAGPIDAGPMCPRDLPRQCPSPAPSYAADVAPLIEQKCLTCHRPGGESPDVALDTYPAVYKIRGQVLDQVYACTMPKAPDAPLNEAERQILLGWLVCGAPDGGL